MNNVVNNEIMSDLFNMEEKIMEEEKADSFISAVAIIFFREIWRGSIVAPTNAPSQSQDVPKERLELEWVHGYRSHDCRNNVVYAISNSIVTHTGRIAVVMNKEGGFQKFMSQHTGDIIALAINTEKKYNSNSGNRENTKNNYLGCPYFRNTSGIKRIPSPRG